MMNDGYNLPLTDKLMSDLAAYGLAKSLDDMSIMDWYADNFYDSTRDYDNPFDSIDIGTFFKELFRMDSSMKVYGTIIDAMDNDKSAQNMVIELGRESLIQTGKDAGTKTGEAALFVLDTTVDLGIMLSGGTSSIGGDVSIAALMFKRVDIASIAGTISLASKGLGTGLKTIKVIYDPSDYNLKNLNNDLTDFQISFMLNQTGAATNAVVKSLSPEVRRYIDLFTGISDKYRPTK
jgi:hypothetical protein